MCRNSSKRRQNDGISLNKHTAQWFVSWTSERHVIKCMSSFFSQNMSELWSYSYQCIVILTSFLYRHKWRHSAIIFGFQKFYLWKSAFSNNFAECKLPSKNKHSSPTKLHFTPDYFLGKGGPKNQTCQFYWFIYLPKHWQFTNTKIL